MKNLLTSSHTFGDPLRGIGPLGLENDPTAEAAPALFNNIISSIIGVLTVIAIVWFLIQIILGAIGIISGGGDKTKLEDARKKITNSIIGLIVVIAAVFILSLIGSLLGIDDLLGGLELLPEISQ